MKYLTFTIENYKAISKVVIDIDKNRLLPLIGANESGKTSILQAIYAFDYSNDKESGGKHLKGIRNLYQPTNRNDAVITAKVKIDKDELRALFSDEEIEDCPELLSMRELNITRFLPHNEENHVPVYEIQEIESQNEDAIAKKIVNHLPYIIYNDDFNQRPTTIIPIPAKEDAILADWLGIYERACISADTSLFELATSKDKNVIKSSLSDVASEINDMLIKEWERLFSNKGERLEINLQIEDSELSVQIIERINGRDRYFDITDRSKGFLWFFNFVMKIRYNPKGTGNTSDVIYLLDEPGSFLHAAAQERLCKMLKSISRKDGEVIYCTHSHHLLNPTYIIPKSIFLVRKNNSGEVSLTRAIDEPGLMTKKNSELQPIFEALDVADWDFFPCEKTVVLVEGIYDKYAIDFFCGRVSGTVIYPGTSASSILERIPQFIALDKKYLAIWDNDEEGIKNFEVAKRKLGQHELRHMYLLPLFNRKRRVRMETFVGKDALKVMKRELELPENSTYEKTLLSTVGIDERKRKAILSKMSSGTIERFENLKIRMLNP